MILSLPRDLRIALKFRQAAAKSRAHVIGDCNRIASLLMRGCTVGDLECAVEEVADAWRDARQLERDAEELMGR